MESPGCRHAVADSLGGSGRRTGRGAVGGGPARRGHIHLAATLARQNGRRPRVWNDFYWVREAAGRRSSGSGRPGLLRRTGRRRGGRRGGCP
jgi:hypothetical protein